MKNNPEPLPISIFPKVKNYSIVCLDNQNIAVGEVYLVDKVHQKIWLYKMKHPAKDVTSAICRRYQKDKDKSLFQQRIIIELYKLMTNMDDILYWTKVIVHSDSAKEILSKLYKVRLLQAEAWVKSCKKPVTWNSDEDAAKYFSFV